MTCKLSQQVAAAFRNNRRFNRRNNVYVWEQGVVMYTPERQGITIAQKMRVWVHPRGAIWGSKWDIKLDFGGQYTDVLRDRLGAICEAYDSPIRFVLRCGKPYVCNTATYAEMPLDVSKPHYLHNLERATLGMLSARPDPDISHF